MYQIGTSNHSYTITPARTSTNTEFGDWRHYGNDQGGTRFSELLQIDPENVIRLRLVWEYTGSDNIANQTTPLKIGRTLFVCTPNGAIALDAENGSSIWRSVIAGTRSTARCRGLAYYRSTSIQGNCAERIISTIVLKDPFDVRLIALDARDGSACSHFGIRGEVSLLTDLGSVPPGYYEVTSAPTIVHDKVVVGGRIMDFQYWGGPSGVVRAFDVLSGKLVWAWDMGDPSRTLAPLPGETYTHSTPNSWAPMSGDDELGLVYVPTGNATPDFFGGNRRAFDDRYSSSVVALDVTSGVPRWSFQTTHHDVWDYDVASQPSLVNFQSGKRLIRGLVQPTKRGEIFVLNRQNGEPLFPVTEIPAPQGTVPEERLAPTQPISPSLPSFRGRDLTESDMWGVTPLDELWCRIHFRAARYSGTLTPPAVGASIQSPSFFGGMNWGGMAIDTARGIGVVTTTYLPLHVQLISREQVTRLSIKRLVPGKGHPPVPLSDQLILDALNPFNSNVNLGLLMNPWRFGGPGDGTPYGSIAASFMSPLQIPCTKPPYGRLSAIDLKTGRLLWTQPFGTMRDAGPFGIPSRIPLPVGMSTNSGAVVTLGGLTFIGATMEKSFRAYETTSGKLLWEDRLPTPSDATPMTYLSLKSQRQFVIVTAGGKYIRAYALPDVPRNDGVSHSSKSRRAI
ncbi:pyrroloquinoline quinone-dependent dehydrogenase [Steroidobacter agaridevorans]|nr:pyrroloquinoline quinone-dependent dehydrogenase [Steroidobacter agaridevorans]